MPKYLLIDTADDTAKAHKTYAGSVPSAPPGFSIVSDDDPSYAARLAEHEAHVAPPDPTYIDKRRPMYREKLAALKGAPYLDEVGVIGSQLDAIITQLVTLAGGVGNLNPELQAVVAEVQAVKAAVPKP